MPRPSISELPDDSASEGMHVSLSLVSYHLTQSPPLPKKNLNLLWFTFIYRKKPRYWQKWTGKSRKKERSGREPFSNDGAIKWWVAESRDQELDLNSLESVPNWNWKSSLSRKKNLKLSSCSLNFFISSHNISSHTYGSVHLPRCYS
jgi:hypothetical protein